MRFYTVIAAKVSPLSSWAAVTSNVAACGDAATQMTLGEVHFAWSGFSDAQTDIVKYEAALGTRPGGIQIQDFVQVDASTSDHHVITNVDLSHVETVTLRIVAIYLLLLFTLF